MFKCSYRTFIVTYGFPIKDLGYNDDFHCNGTLIKVKFLNAIKINIIHDYML